jgi:hypothetical protein
MVTQPGVNFNIMGANKPRKLEALTHQNIKKFKSEFTNYHYEINGQAALQGHISDEIVVVIDSLLGAQEEYRHLLCHGDVEVMYLSEERRALRPWLRTSDPEKWGKLLEALLVLKPPGGAYQTQTYEHLMARAETSLLNFAYDHSISGEDRYIERLVESERVCDVAQYTPEQVRAYFSLLIVGSKVPGATYKGFNVSNKSKDLQDASRLEVMKEKAMLSLKNFKKTRQFVDWLIGYLKEMRAAVSAAESFQGKTSASTNRGGFTNRGRGPSGPSSDPQGHKGVADDSLEESILVLHQGSSGQFPEGPCKGCGTPHQHRRHDSPAIPHSQCPLREHPDWNEENIQFSESVAGRRMKDLRIPFMNKGGARHKTNYGSLVERLQSFHE